MYVGCKIMVPGNDTQKYSGRYSILRIVIK